MPDQKTITPGQTMFGNGPFTIEDVTNNAVILLRAPESDWYGVMNLDIQDAPQAHDLVDEFVRKYLAAFDIASEVKPSNIEAIVIGGDFTRHVVTDSGHVVEAAPYHLARRKAEEALAGCGIRTKYIETDARADKRVLIDKEGLMTYSEERKGYNATDAVTTLRYYKDWKSRNDCG
ncbi:hypothetical protein KY363_04300 [Candidatus Woesearchaeota archaeon]|nr:hypothetical protein [Candidatus Woesearchaeota archaeon]